MTDRHITHILLPLIDTPHMQAAFPVAKTLEGIISVPLHVLTTDEQPLTVSELAQRLQVPPESLDGLVIDQVKDLIGAVLSKAKAWGRVMVVLAARLSGETPKGAAEKLACEVLQKVPCPILIVPPDKDMTHWRLRRQLLPQDGTPSCADALAHVVSRSSQKGIESLVLRVAGAQIGQPKERGSLAMPHYVDQPQHEWEMWGQEFLDRVAGLGENLDRASLRLLVATGEPGAEILRVACEEAVDMIVLPWHGHLGRDRALIIKTVLESAPCPILLLTQKGDQDS